MTTTSTHRAGPADLDALALLFDGYRQFYGQASDVPRAREWLRERLRFGESVVLVATRAGKPVGFGVLKYLGAEPGSGAGNNPLMAGFAVIIGLMLWFNLVMQWLLLTTAWIATGPRSDRG